MKVEQTLKHAKGNLLDMAEAGQFEIVVQGCNCFNTMGGGIAKEIRERYDTVMEADRISPYSDYNKLGNWTVGYAWFGEGIELLNFTIINAYTQYDMSTGEDVFEYTAFELILQKLAYIYPGKRFGFPYIGMGLAKGDKERIIPMIENFANQITAQGGSVTLVEFG